jgi:hypothetical protein
LKEKIMHRRFVNTLHHHSKKKLLYYNLTKFIVVMQYVAWLKWYKIQIKRCLKNFFSLKLINVIPYWCIILNLMCQIRKVNNSSKTETWLTNKQLNHASSSMIYLPAWYFNTILYHNTLLLNNNIHSNIYYPIIFSN